MTRREVTTYRSDMTNLELTISTSISSANASSNTSPALLRQLLCTVSSVLNRQATEGKTDTQLMTGETDA